MTITLRFRRRRRAALCAKAAVSPPPAVRHCTCTIPHPVTAEERALVKAVLAVAERDGDLDLAGYLKKRLTTKCRTSTGASVADGILCDCGSGHRPWEHNPHLYGGAA